MHRIIREGHNPEHILYFNFEDEQLKPYSPQLLSEVLDTFFAMRPSAKRGGAFLFFDEIQEVLERGAFLRRVIDTEKVTLYVTGSSSKMLSTGLASEFRGRLLSRELFPMSFSEFVRYCGVELKAAGEGLPQAFGSTISAQLRNLLPEYLKRGGSSQHSLFRHPIGSCCCKSMRTGPLTWMSSNVTTFAIRWSRCSSSLVAWLRRGRELSVNKLVAQFKSAGIATSRATLSSLLSYYQEAYLLFELKEFSRALAQNARAVSKVYAIDPGMLMAFPPRQRKMWRSVWKRRSLPS